MMRKWLVMRYWEVDAEKASEAIERAMPGEHYETRTMIVSDSDPVSAIVRTRQPEAWVLTDVRDGTEWVISNGKWRRRVATVE